MGLFDIFKSKKSKSFGTMHGMYINDWTDGFKTDHKGLSDFVNNKLIVKKVTKKIPEDNIEIEELSDWSTSDDNKLIALYKRNVPEIALSKMFKKTISEVRERIIHLMKK